MEKNKKNKKEKFESIDKKLDDVLKNSDLNNINIYEDNTEIIKTKTSSYTDFLALKKDCDNKAADFIDYLVNFYLNEEILNDSYIKKRIDDDKETLSDLLYQMKTSEIAILKLLEVIDNGGDIVPRNFEVLASLQRSKMEIVKHYEALKLSIENNYKNIMADYIRKIESQRDSVEISGYSQRKLLEKIRKENSIDDFNKNKIEEAEYTIQEIKLPPGVKFYKKNNI